VLREATRSLIQIAGSSSVDLRSEQVPSASIFCATVRAYSIASSAVARSASVRPAMPSPRNCRLSLPTMSRTLARGCDNL
jgi:hypothetical protein